MSETWISLGSNLGDREGTLARAVDLLGRRGVSPLRVSHLYETSPEDGAPEPLYLNAVLQGRTDLAPSASWAYCSRLRPSWAARPGTVRVRGPAIWISVDGRAGGGRGRAAAPASSAAAPSRVSYWSRFANWTCIGAIRC